MKNIRKTWCVEEKIYTTCDKNNTNYDHPKIVKEDDELEDDDELDAIDVPSLKLLSIQLCILGTKTLHCSLYFSIALT